MIVVLWDSIIGSRLHGAVWAVSNVVFQLLQMPLFPPEFSKELAPEYEKAAAALKKISRPVMLAKV